MPPRMMDYYEELGISRSASTDEIRQAYRQLMRVLHPDHCQDEPARRLAEIQAKRLNAILAVLTHAEQRALYDLAASADGRPRGVPWKGADRGAPMWFWPLLCGLLAASLILVSTSKPEPRTFSAALPSEAPVQPELAQKPKPAPRSLRSHDENGVPSPASTLVPDLVTAIEPQHFEPQARLAAPEVATEPAPTPPEPGARGMPGEWFFPASAHRTKAGQYAAEYIELRLVEAAGRLHGRYRGRYRITDQAISPTVAFEFEGVAGTDRAVLPWKGPGGADGEITLSLLSQDTLEVTWTARHLGNELGLISGSATLVRKQD